MKEMDMQSVLPLLTAPSQRIASKEEKGLEGHHQVRAVSCFFENGTNEALLIFHLRCSESLCSVFQCGIEWRNFLFAAAGKLRKFFQCVESVEKFDFHAPPLGRLISEMQNKSSFSSSPGSGGESAKSSLIASQTEPYAILLYPAAASCWEIS